MNPCYLLGRARAYGIVSMIYRRTKCSPVRTHTVGITVADVCEVSPLTVKKKT